MKYNKLAILIFFAVLPLFGNLSAQSIQEQTDWLDSKDTICVIFFDGLAPYSFIDKSGEPSGFAVEIAREIGASLNKSVRYKFRDPRLTDLNSLTDSCDFLAGVFRDNNLEGQWRTSRPIIQSQFSVFTDEKTKIANLKELSGKPVCVHPASPAIDVLERICGPENLYSKSPAEALTGLANGSFKAVVLPVEVGDYYISKLGLTESIHKNSSIILKFDYVIAVPIHKASVAGRLDRIVEDLKLGGDLSSIRGRWLAGLQIDEEETSNNRYFIIIALVIALVAAIYIISKMRTSRISFETEMAKKQALKREYEDLQKQFAGLINSASSANIGFFCLQDDDEVFGRFVYANKGLENITGYSFEDLNKKSFVELFEGDNLNKVIERYKLRRKGEEQPESYEVEGIRSDGERRPIELSVRVVRLSDADVTVGILKDLSREKTLQNKLRESDQNFRAMLSSMPNGAIVFNNQRILYINNAFRKLIGKSPEWIRSSGISKILPPVHRTRVEALISNMLDDKDSPKEIQFEIIGSEGNLILITARPRLVSYFGEKAVLLIIDSKETEESSRSARSGHPSAVFSKSAEDLVLEYNNSIMSIIGAVNRLEVISASDVEQSEFTGIIEKETERLSELTGKLMSLTKEADEKKGRVISIHSIIRDALELLPKPPSGELSIKTFFNARPDSVRGNMAQVHQLILNLMVNAIEAMPEGGELTLITGNTVFETPYNITEETIRPGRYVWISVKDSGKGLSDHELENIFRPFFKGRHTGTGMGLGLSLVQKLVSKHDGFIQAESEEQSGTTFTVYLPEELPVKEERGTGKQLPRGEETVLVVDDEPHIRTVLNSMLGYLGYEVLLASNGTEAIEILRSRDKNVDIVLLDIIMPEMGGEEAYRNIKNISPDVKVILSTGYARDQVLSDLLQQGANALIRKPYSVGTISQIIRETLDSKD